MTWALPNMNTLSFKMWQSPNHAALANNGPFALKTGSGIQSGIKLSAENCCQDAHEN
jgi:hypothetical protein